MDSNIQKYLSFVKTVEYGSFTKAAEILNYSQSGISRMIKDLEDDWNIILLERGKSGVRLTSDGLTLLPYARNIIAEYEKLVGEIRELSGLQSGLIRIAAVESFADSSMPEIISRYSADYPGIDIELITGSCDEIEGWIAQGRIDVGVSKLPAPDDFDSVFLGQEKLMAVFPSASVPKDIGSVSIAALCDDSFIMPDKSFKSEILSLFERGSLSPKIKYTVSGEQTALSMVKKGLGITILPKSSLISASEGTEAREIEIPAYINIGIIMKNKKTASLAVKRMIEYFD